MWLRMLLLVLALAADGHAARGEERITSFVADIKITRDGEVRVTEAISIQSEGIRFKHGIYRDLALAPIFAQDGASKLEIDAVKRDGEAEPFRVEDRDGNKRIHIGSPEVALNSGPHRYEIVYRTDNRIRDAGDDDMFAWDVTGSSDFAIETASATVHLPNGVKILGMQFHAGAPEAPADNVRPTVNRGAITFSTIRGLQPGERLLFKIKMRGNAIKRPPRN